MPTTMTVIFDFGGVLVKWAPQEVVADLFAEESVRAAVMQGVFRHADWLALDQGVLEVPEAIVRFSTRTGIAAAQIATLLQRIRESLTAIPESVDLLRSLASRGVPLYGLSNMPAETFDFLQSRYDFWAVFKGIVVSGRIGLMKPDPAIFRHLLAEYGLRPAECIFIDDHEPNVAAARSAGMRAIRFENAGACALELHRMLDMTSGAAHVPVPFAPS